jgi:hypothetical protein
MKKIALMSAGIIILLPFSLAKGSGHQKTTNCGIWVNQTGHPRTWVACVTAAGVDDQTTGSEADGSDICYDSAHEPCNYLDGGASSE